MTTLEILLGHVYLSFVKILLNLSLLTALEISKNWF